MRPAVLSCCVSDLVIPKNPVSLASHKQPAPHPSLAASLLISKLCWTKLEPLLAVG